MGVADTIPHTLPHPISFNNVHRVTWIPYAQFQLDKSINEFLEGVKTHLWTYQADRVCPEGPHFKVCRVAGTHEQVLHVIWCDPTVWALVVDVWVNTVHVVV